MFYNILPTLCHFWRLFTPSFKSRYDCTFSVTTSVEVEAQSFKNFDSSLLLRQLRVKRELKIYSNDKLLSFCPVPTWDKTIDKSFTFRYQLERLHKKLSSASRRRDDVWVQDRALVPKHCVQLPYL